jgi:Arc/MetJ-type ribon-helix-helix transcriptional regulator
LELIVHKFNYNAPAVLFPSRNKKIANKVKYRRFDRAAEAIRYAVEELPEPLLLGAFIEMENERLGHKDIRALYDSADFPLAKTAAATALV